MLKIYKLTSLISIILTCSMVLTSCPQRSADPAKKTGIEDIWAPNPSDDEDYAGDEDEYTFYNGRFTFSEKSHGAGFLESTLYEGTYSIDRNSIPWKIDCKIQKTTYDMGVDWESEEITTTLAELDENERETYEVQLTSLDEMLAAELG